MIKVVAYCDSPTCATGFATVSRNILDGLYGTGRYEINVFGVNYWGEPHDYPYSIWPTGINSDNDPYGRKYVFEKILNMDFDILFFMQDSFILDFVPQLVSDLKNSGKVFRSICYFPVDGKPKEQWLDNVLCTDMPVTYSEYANSNISKVTGGLLSDAHVIPHGVNTGVFNPLSKEEIGEFRKSYFNVGHEVFIITNVNRNQQRKDIPRTIHAFKEFKKIVPTSILYLHMAKIDQGWNLPEVCNTFGLEVGKDVYFPYDFGPNKGFSIEIVNKIYNASNCVVSTSLGEGWGLSWTEAMATKTPVIMPDNTVFSEYITEDKGYLVSSGGDLNHFTMLPNDLEVLRPLVDVKDMVENLKHVYFNAIEAEYKADVAYSWVVNNLNWQKNIVPKWIGMFDEAYMSLS